LYYRYLSSMQCKNGEGISLESILAQNHKKYLQRIDFYKQHGYDIEKERSFILDKAAPIYGETLEVGTGKGYFTVALAKEGNNFTSVDISKEEQEFARLNLKYLGLENQVDMKIENAECLSFANESIDIIFSVNTIHHFINPLKVINELLRVVSFEGKLILSDFSAKGLEIIDKIHMSEGRNHEASCMNLNKIRQYLLDKRLKVEEHRTELQELLIAYQPYI